eukprot:364425-Chlamydomonas_euryale.AAC.10
MLCKSARQSVIAAAWVLAAEWHDVAPATRLAASRRQRGAAEDCPRPPSLPALLFGASWLPARCHHRPRRRCRHRRRGRRGALPLPPLPGPMQLTWSGPGSVPAASGSQVASGVCRSPARPRSCRRRRRTRPCCAG